MKLWIDDVRPAPEGYVRIWSVNEAIRTIEVQEKYRLRLIEQQEAAYQDGRDEYAKDLQDMLDNEWSSVEIIDIDHDAGQYARDGGDYIKLLDWLEETGRNYPIRIHSMNPVGVANMRAIIKKNGWTEVSNGA